MPETSGLQSVSPSIQDALNALDDTVRQEKKTLALVVLMHAEESGVSLDVIPDPTMPREVEQAVYEFVREACDARLRESFHV